MHRQGSRPMKDPFWLRAYALSSEKRDVVVNRTTCSRFKALPSKMKLMHMMHCRK